MWQSFDKDKPLKKAWVYPDVGIVTRNDLEIAKYVLSQFTVVLIMEKLQQQSALLAHYFGVKTDDIRPRNWIGGVDTKQITDMKPLDETEYNYLLEVNALDLELYEFARQLSHCNMYMTYLDKCPLS
jgi:hypothetical protein